ncbi:MAG: hypothetical protein Q8P18_21935 [Pseudomonadota bacterium]|nr:hypothetical protein [Pseudomonadota bacterium]
MSKREWREAEKSAGQGRWEEAGPRYAALAERARRVMDRREQRDAAALAADAYRRDDQPAAAAKMLLLAREGGRDEASDSAQLAAVLLDAGQIDAAYDIASAALLRASAAPGGDPVGTTLALDTLVGLCLTRGEVEVARAHLDRLAALALPGSELSRRFRAAQVDRLDGLVSAAEQAWLALAAELEPHAQASGPAGAAWSELGEIDLLRAAFFEGSDTGGARKYCERAIERFDRALACWTRAGRRAGVFRAEAWAARARAVAGETLVAPGIDRAIAYAIERGMPLLEADLRACRAVVKGDPDDLLHALDRLGEAPLARGRVRVLTAELGGSADLELALTELAPDGPWRARAMRALGRRTGNAYLVEEAATLGAAWFEGV